MFNIVNKLPKEYLTLKGKKMCTSIYVFTKINLSFSAAQRAAITRPTPISSCGHNHVHVRSFSDDQQNEDGDEEGGSKGKKMDPTRDRRIPVDLDVGLQYMKSNGREKS